MILLSQDPASRAAAAAALGAFPGGLHVGGGVTAENAAAFLDAGASHVIVTSYVFRDGAVDEERLGALVRPSVAAGGRSHAGLAPGVMKKHTVFDGGWRTNQPPPVDPG